MNNKLKVLKTIADNFNETGIHYAIGASVLLYFKGIVDEFHDLDIMIDLKDTDKVKKIMDDLGTLQYTPTNNNFKTKVFLQYVIDDVDIDVIGGFIIVKDGVDYNCYLQKEIDDYVDLDGTKIPLDTIDNWYKYYSLMNRDNKVKMIEDYKKDISTK